VSPDRSCGSTARSTKLSVARVPESGHVRVQLGPGQRHYLDGWINVDANMFTAKCDVWSDISGKLPFRDESIDAIYSHHVIEHLPDLPTHFRELHRVLKPGGVIRVGGPNGDAAMREYVAGNHGVVFRLPGLPQLHRRAL
jgi:predicted SAM-dependent methyltransferase